MGAERRLPCLEEEIPDLVLLDLVMQISMAFSSRTLAQQCKNRPVPVIVVTGKILSYEDVKRLDVPKVLLQTKGVLSALESVLKFSAS